MKNRIQICMGSSCFARGNERHLEMIETYLAKHRLTAEIELYGSRCEGKCSEGPNLSINTQAYHRMDPESLIDVLQGHFTN